MACASHVLIFLLFSQVALAMATIPLLGQCHNSCEEELNLSLYLHQVVTGANQNQEVIISSNFPNSFGLLAVSDWTIRVSPEPTASIVARAKGMVLQATQSQADGVAWFFPFSMVFQDSRFGGSTLQVMGTISTIDGEWAIVGGTGKLSMARGTIKFKTTNSGVGSFIRQIDIHAFYSPPPAV